MIGADILAARLAAAGCKRAFGIPGGEVLALIDAIDRAGIRFILTKHENAAGFMAEGGWHADGAIPVLIATLGPGVANAVNVVANAMQDRVPLLFLTGCVDRGEAESYTHQVFDHQALLRPIVKASFRAERGTIGLVTEKALALAFDGQPGPVHIDLPVSVAEAETQEGVDPRLGPPRSPARFRAAEDAVFVDAVRALSAAKKPLAIAGVDAVNDNAGPAIEAFCKRHGVPLVTTYKGKGLIDEDDPIVVAAAGLSPMADRIVLPLVADADCILLLGYDPIEMRAGWREPWPSSATVVEISPVLRTHGMHFVGHRLHGRISETLESLQVHLKPSETWANAAPRAVKAALREAFPVKAAFGPGEVFAALREAMPRETIATADSGAHRILLSQMWHCRAPRSLLQSSALCTMGCAVPLAAGYKLAEPGRPIIAFVGDAGLEMGLGELATLRDLEIPVVVVVLVDHSLALIELKQRASQRPNLGVDFPGTDFPAVVRALGGESMWIDDVDTLKREAVNALARDRFTVLACRIGRCPYDGKF